MIDAQPPSLDLPPAAAASFRGRTVLVTGGFGFVGSHVCKALLDLGAVVTVLDLRTDRSVPSLLNLEGHRERLHVIRGDIADAALVTKIIHGGAFSHLFHFAAYATVIEKAVEHPYDTIVANTMGWVNVMEAARTSPTPPEVVFFSSTDKVYGEMDGDAYQEGETPLRGIGVYDAAKLAADVLGKTYNEVFGVPTVVLRMCNLFGPHDFNTSYRLIPKAMASLFGAAEPQPPELYFDSLEHKRDYLYIDDAVRAILLVAHHPGCRGDVFNLLAAHSAGTPDILRTLVRLAAQREQSDDPQRAEKILRNGITVRLRDADAKILAIKKQHLDGSKLRRTTGFVPLVDFEEGMRRTIESYRRHFTRIRPFLPKSSIAA
jgi:nucleoside-diphosphate-sugar epimerase